MSSRSIKITVTSSVKISLSTTLKSARYLLSVVGNFTSFVAYINSQDAIIALTETKTLVSPM